MSNEKNYFVYILANQPYGTLYIGITNHLARRIYEHKHDLIEGFTKKYQVHELVYYESFRQVQEAIAAEKRIKKWKRRWKIELIEKKNPIWEDLYNKIIC